MAEHLKIKSTSAAKDALLIIQAQQPELVLLQVGIQDDLGLCQTIKQQKQLAWIYVLVIEAIASKKDTGDIKQHTLRVSETLEWGADAYICLTMVDENFSAEKRLLHAQLRVGFRRIQEHRDMVRTHDLLSKLALADPLTQLNNRRAFERELPWQIHHARDWGIPFSVMMLDVDFFKDINDTYGHLVGDSALKLVAARLRHNLRFYDTLFRYGGEEFVILLSNTAHREAKLIGERLCELFSQQPIVIKDEIILQLTISIGMASLRSEDDEKGMSLLRRADFYLLNAKSKGRNQVLSAEEAGGWDCMKAD